MAVCAFSYDADYVEFIYAAFAPVTLGMFALTVPRATNPTNKQLSQIRVIVGSEEKDLKWMSDKKKLTLVFSLGLAGAAVEPGGWGTVGVRSHLQAEWEVTEGR